jgi:hypothetical protein
LPATVEEIPDEDTVSRLIDFPRMYEEARRLIWDQVFQFPGGDCESLVWRRYAATDEEVHRLGCEREVAKRVTKPEMRYAGFISALSGAIRSIRTNRGHGFGVNHAPEEGVHHAEVCYSPVGDGLKLKPADKAELKLALKGKFGDLASYSCTEGGA